MSEMVGQQIGRYRIDALLGEGNMGAVYQAYDTLLARKVVLKVMHRQLASHESFQQRFMQEAQAAARLDHPSIVRIYSFDTEPNLYMVMEHVEGPSLSSYFKHHTAKNELVNLDTILRLVAQVADALDYAHSRGVIHRDIKPSNILLKPLTRPDRDGDPALRVVVTDFGLAKLLDGGMHTLTGTFMGTLSYMSPEQCLGRELDGRSDIYSLGIVLYQLATGQLPFNVKSPTDAIRMHVKELPPAPRLIRPQLPEMVERVILQAIAKNPANRFQTGNQLATALRRVAASLFNPGDTSATMPSGDVRSNGRSSDTTPPAAVDQLIVYRAGESPRVIGLTAGELLIGRGQESDVVLPDKGVSRQHARLERSSDGWQVVDLASTNGTYVDRTRVAPQASEPWPADKELRVGPYTLQWQKALPIPQAGPAADEPEPPAVTAPGELVVVVDPAVTTVQAGESTHLQVMLVNNGPLVEHVSLRHEGLPADWVAYSESLVKLMPGSRAFVRLTIQPPRSSRAESGLHTLQIFGVPMSNTAATALADCQINIDAFSSFETRLLSGALRNAGRCQFEVVNLGNAEANFVVGGRAGDAPLRFEPDSVKLRARGGDSAHGEIGVATVRRPWLGARERVPFQLEVWTAGAGSQFLRAELEIRPKIPVWFLLFLLMLLVALVVFLVLVLT